MSDVSEKSNCGGAGPSPHERNVHSWDRKVSQASSVGAKCSQRLLNQSNDISLLRSLVKLLRRSPINISSLRDWAVHISAAWRWLLILATAVIALSVVAVSTSRGTSVEIQNRFLAAASDLPEQQEPSGDFSKFTHTNPMHKRLPCLLCHRRESNSPIPARPGKGGHLPCAGCHSAQFANSSSPICGICHTDVQKGALKPFPTLRSFKMKFDHARHVSMSNVSCATCHRPAAGGVAMSIPARFNAHTTCYQCHTPRAQSGGRDISSCGICHQLGAYARTSQTAPAFKLGFSHGKHDGPKGLKCTDCHFVKAGTAQRKQVSAPLPLNHHAPAGAESCMTCHNGKRAFGGDDFTVCKRCHSGPQWHF
jgi:Cytochrome c7 and related cytochrome c